VFCCFWLGFRHDAGVEEAISSCACSGQYLHGHSVLLGSLGRIPLGLLADRFGGRKVFSLTMVSGWYSANEQ
jgi:hypothetical protein